MMNVCHGDDTVVLFGFRPQSQRQLGASSKLRLNVLHVATTEGLPRVGRILPDPFADTK